MTRDSEEQNASELFDTAEFESFESQVARFYESQPRTHIRVELAGKTHQGLIRTNNEDQYLAVRRYRGHEVLLTNLPSETFNPIDDQAYAMAIADGLGGRKFGEIASSLALRTALELAGDEIKWPVPLNAHEIEEIRQKAVVFCRLIDESLRAEIRETPGLAGMGTTLTICYSTGPNLFTIHAGDSRAYLHRKGTLQQLTRDHTLGQQLVDSGYAEPHSPEAHRLRHVLTNCLGGSGEGVIADVEHRLIEDGDLVLLCTDGLSSMVSDVEIAAVLNQHLSPEETCETLVNLALEHGGRDNVTVVVARYHIDEHKCTVDPQTSPPDRSHSIE